MTANPRPNTEKAVEHDTGLARKLFRTPLLVSICLIRCYQATIRPLLLGNCKFCPTCSEYAIESLKEHGLLRGGWIAFRRVIRCHPFSPGGFDPVPSRRD